MEQHEYETLAEFRFILRRFLHFSEIAAQRVGVPPQQHQALLAIKGFAGRDQVTIGELAERLVLRHNSTVGLVDRMVEQGYVQRNPGPDGRTVYVGLTEHGEAVLAELSTIHRAELRQLAPVLLELLMLLNH